MNSKEIQGQRLYNMRKMRGMRQDELAKAAGVSRVAISNYEWGKYNPDIPTLYKFAEVLHCDITDIANDDVAEWIRKARNTESMTLNSYQTLAQRTANGDLDVKGKLINGAMGLCGESGEVIDHVKKHFSQGHKLDVDKIIDELGDVLWYIAETASACGATMEEIARLNIGKLKKRYPAGFEADKSINREGKHE